MDVPDLDRAVELLRDGKLVAFPTETVYGLGADATNESAIRGVYDVKGRPATNPLICHVAGETVAVRYAKWWPATAHEIAKAFWPGPITIVVEKTTDITDLATAGGSTVGLRAPNHPLTLELLRRFDRPLAGPSANRSTRVSPTTAAHVREELGDKVDLILDGGPCTVGIKSTVLDLTADHPAILRPGHITRAQIEDVIGPVLYEHRVIRMTATQTSPGQQAVHYAPQTPAYRFERSQRHLIDATRAAVIDCDPDPIAYARTMYERLRALDSQKLRAIYVEMPPDEPRWLAVRDRLVRATKPLS
jgi:L-threonylcarbamoyladenylate synthase